MLVSFMQFITRDLSLMI